MKYFKFLRSVSKRGDLGSDIRGYVDESISPRVYGWVSCDDIDEPLLVHIVKGDESQTVLADIERPDVLAAGVSKRLNCGFETRFSERNFAMAKAQVLIPVKEIERTEKNYAGRNVFFMHIPKTAGSSVNDLLQQSCPEGQFLSHIEGIRNQWLELARPKQILSGHIGYNEYKKNFGDQSRVVISFFRDPYRQLISHFYWVRHLSEPEKKDFLNGHSNLIKSISKRLSEFDLSSISGLRDYIQSMETKEIKLFDNFQVRFLTAPIKGVRVSDDDCREACSNLHRIHIVGIVEDMKGSFNSIARYLKLPNKEFIPSKNVNPYNYGIDINDEHVREILYPLVQYDLRLYEAVYSKYQSQLELLKI